ncbi:ATP-binding protein [Arcobacter sp.]|uniref:ATP-binding protein n=1 Tax=Arcobacter sp. TaxID=1872629 RepID=UPI003D0E9211
MKKTILSMLLVATISFASSVTIEGFSSPESVIVKNKDVYVSNVGKELKPTAKDGDGFISKLDTNGKIKELHFIDGLNAPKGMGIIGSTLFVADVDTVKGFDIKTKKEVFSLSFDNVGFLNDITIKDNHTLFVSATDVGAIYEVNIKNKSYKKVIDFTTANGLFYKDGILYAAELGSSPKTMFDGKGKFYQINLKNKKLTQLGTFEGVLDGVQKVGNKIYVSDWVNFEKSGIIRVYDLKTKKEYVLKVEPFMGAADLWIDEKSNKLYLPQMIGNKLTIIEL